MSKRETVFSFLLFISALLLGVFLATFDTAAHSIFFEVWQQTDIAMAYLFSGLLGVVLFGIYTFLHKRLSFKFFNFLNLLLMGGIVISYFVFYFFYKSDLVAFAGLVIMFPINLLGILNFWRYLRKLLLPYQTRRLFSRIEIGLITGILISAGSYVVLLNHYDYTILALIAISSLLGLFIFQIPVNLYHSRSDIFNHTADTRIPVKASLFILWSTKFTRALVVFALLSSATGFFLHYGFVNLFRIKFWEVESFSMYYILFIAIMFLIILFSDRLLIHKMLYSYDSPYALVLLPLGVAFFFLMTILGTLVLRKIDHANPLPFLLLIGINKIVYEVGKNALQVPSLRSLYRALDIRFLQLIFPRIEGGIVMMGMVIAGALIILTQQFITSIVLFGSLGIVVSIIWLVFAVRLVKQYKIALQDTYRKLRISRSENYKKKTYDEKIRKILVGDEPVKVINAMKLSARIEPLSYEKGLQRMLANPQPAIQDYVFKCIGEEALIELLPELKKIEPASEKAAQALNSLIKSFEERAALMQKGVDLEKLVSSRKVSDRVLAAEIIGARRDVTYTSYLVNLSREFEPAVKIAAVKAMARISSSDHSYLLIEYLTSPDYHAYAFEALVQIGDPGLDYLERLFINPNTDDTVLARVLRIYGKVGTTKAVDLLLGKLEDHSQKVTLAAINALHEANFQANSMNVHRILNIIVRTIHVLGWNYLVSSSLSEKAGYKDLKEAYLQEIENGYDLLFDLLSLAYNARTIYEIRDLLYNGSKADISHAIEMLDHFVYEDIKPVLFPVIEDISVEERVKRLQYYFPIEKMTEVEMITSSLVRDYNLLAIYPRICAMQLALTKHDFEINQELISNLFHPNRLLREVAATVIYEKDPEMFESVFDRLDDGVQFELRELLANIENKNKLLMIEKFNLLKNTDKLGDMPEAILIEFAEAFEEYRFKPDKTLDLQANLGDFSLFFMVSGSMTMLGENGLEHHTQCNELYYSSIFLNAGINKLTFTEDSLVLAINDISIENLLFDHSEIASCVLSCVEQFKLAG